MSRAPTGARARHAAAAVGGLRSSRRALAWGARTLAGFRSHSGRKVLRHKLAHATNHGPLLGWRQRGGAGSSSGGGIGAGLVPPAARGVATGGRARGLPGPSVELPEPAIGAPGRG